MPFCTNCGAPMEGLYCTKCGAKSGEASETPSAPTPPSATTPPARKSKVLTYVLLGCGGLVVVAVVSAIALGLFVRQRAGDISKNPAMAAAKMVAALNPDIEVVSADEATGRITLREKKTGKTITMDFRDVQKGRIRFEDESGERVDIETEGEGKSGSFRVTTPEGEFRAGQGSLADLPSLVPLCPGAQPSGAFSAQSLKEDSGMLQIRCGGSVEQVTAFYEGAMKAVGMSVQRHAAVSGGAHLVILTGENRSAGHSMNATITSSDGGTAANILYKSRP
ncbi:MAG: hypothetical protein K6T61_14370 [Bryobacteraceae bacterium]|nr:hypothetical protein [Bryobacteraceae bacterium]